MYLEWKLCRLQRFISFRIYSIIRNNYVCQSFSNSQSVIRIGRVNFWAPEWTPASYDNCSRNYIKILIKKVASFREIVEIQKWQTIYFAIFFISLRIIHFVLKILLQVGLIAGHHAIKVKHPFNWKFYFHSQRRFSL